MQRLGAWLLLLVVVAAVELPASLDGDSGVSRTATSIPGRFVHLPSQSSHCFRGPHCSADIRSPIRSILSHNLQVLLAATANLSVPRLQPIEIHVIVRPGLPQVVSVRD